MKRRYSKMMLFITVLAALLLALGAGGVYADDDDDDDGDNGDRVLYQVTIENLTGGQPFTPPVVATHKGGVRLFRVGKAASFPSGSTLNQRWIPG